MVKLVLLITTINYWITIQVESWNPDIGEMIHDAKCKIYECCDSPYLIKNFDYFDESVNNLIVGQPFVKKIVSNALRLHYNSQILLKKPLVLSFHGSTGTSKTLVSQLISQSLYKKGIKSRFYHYFSAMKDFPNHNQVAEYKENVNNIIESSVKSCKYSFFVFDDTEQMPMELIDFIASKYLTHEQKVETSIDYRSSIFLFISSTSSKSVTQKTIELELKGIKREHFEINIFEKLIIHQKNDMAWYSKLIQNHLIDHLIPFLPLDIIHVKICIQNELRKYPVNIKSSENFYQDLNRMSQELDYDPQNSQKKYSTSGCKRVPVLVRNFIIEKGLAEYLNNEL